MLTSFLQSPRGSQAIASQLLTTLVNLEFPQHLLLGRGNIVVCASWAFLLACLLLSFLQDSDELVSKWYFRGHTIFCNLSSVNIRLR